MIYKITLSSNAHIAIENDDDLEKIIKAIHEPNAKMIITKHGIFNLSFLVAITADDDAEEKLIYARKCRGSEESAIQSVVGQPHFQRLIKQMSIGDGK